MNVVLEGYKPLLMYTSPASIPQIVAHIQDYLIKNPIVSIETIAQIIVQALQEHPELLNGSVIPISEDDEQSIKEYIDSLPLVDGYTKAEINLLLSGKQDTLTFDQTPTPGSSNPVTSSGIIAAMSALQSSLETMINLKADAASTYTKTQVDTKLLDKANVSDVYSKNTMDAKLLEIDTDISGIQTDLSTQSQQIDDLETATAFVEDGDTATKTSYTVGELLLWKGKLYTVTSQIPLGQAIAGNVTAITNGGLNTLNTRIRQKTNFFEGQLVFNGEGFSVSTPPISNHPVCIIARNRNDGSIYALWYRAASSEFYVGAVISGNAPNINDPVNVFYPIN